MAGEIEQWASDALARWDAQLHAHSAEIRELREAGIAETTIEQLYPLASSYNAALTERINDVQFAREASKIFSKATSSASRVLPLLSPAHAEHYNRLHRTSRYDELPRTSFASLDKDPWTSDFYLGMLLQGVYSAPILLTCLANGAESDAAEEELLLVIEAGDFHGLKKAVEDFLLLLEARPLQ